MPVIVTWSARVHVVRAREVDLETALFNLMDNAVRFSPPGTPVEVAVRDAAGGGVTIVIRDHGPGIPGENLTRIFDRFFTTDSERNGTGLGLAIVKSIVSAHGGTIVVASEPNEGATFSVVLPGLRPTR